VKAVRDAAAAAIDVRALIEALRADPALARELGSVLLAAVATAATPTEWSSRKGCAPPGYSDRRWRAIAKQIGTLRGRWYVVSASALARYEAGERPAVAPASTSPEWSPSLVAERLGLAIAPPARKAAGR